MAQQTPPREVRKRPVTVKPLHKEGAEGGGWWKRWALSQRSPSPGLELLEGGPAGAAHQHPRWVLVSALGTRAANYPSAPVPTACLG